MQFLLMLAMLMLACVRICVNRLMKYNNQPLSLWTIDHCPIVIFFRTALSNLLFFVFLVEQCQEKKYTNYN